METTILLFPDIAMIAIGCLLMRTRLWTGAFWRDLERMVYFLLFPALLFNTILKTDLGAAGALPAATVALATVAVGIALGFLARPLLGPQSRQFSSGVQCAFRFNSYVLLAVSQRLAGEPGLALAAIVMGVTVPILNVAAVWPLARSTNSGLIRELVRNPLILATVAGLAGNLAGLALPEPIDATIRRLGSASLALGLLAAGAGLRFERAPDADAASHRSALRLTAWFTTVKLLAMPVTALLLSSLLGVPPLAQQVAVLYAAMPTAPAAYILASRMGGDGPFVAMLVTVSMLVALAVLPIWANLAR
jgi:predicted permease